MSPFARAAYAGVDRWTAGSGPSPTGSMKYEGLANIREAIVGCLEVRAEKGDATRGSLIS